MLKSINILNVNACGEAPESALKKEVWINPEGILRIEPLPQSHYGVSVVDIYCSEIRVIPPSEVYTIKLMDGTIYEALKSDLNDFIK